MSLKHKHGLLHDKITPKVEIQRGQIIITIIIENVCRTTFNFFCRITEPLHEAHRKLRADFCDD